MRGKKSALIVLTAVIQLLVHFLAARKHRRLAGLRRLENVIDVRGQGVAHQPQSMALESPGISVFVLGDIESDQTFLCSRWHMHTECGCGAVHPETGFCLLRSEQFGVAGLHRNGTSRVDDIAVEPSPTLCPFRRLLQAKKQLRFSFRNGWLKRIAFRSQAGRSGAFQHRKLFPEVFHRPDRGVVSPAHAHWNCPGVGAGAKLPRDFFITNPGGLIEGSLFNSKWHDP